MDGIFEQFGFDDSFLRPGRYFQTGHFTSNSRWWFFTNPFEETPDIRGEFFPVHLSCHQQLELLCLPLEPNLPKIMSSHHTKPRDITIRSIKNTYSERKKWNFTNLSSLPTPWTCRSIAEHGTVVWKLALIYKIFNCRRIINFKI